MRLENMSQIVRNFSANDTYWFQGSTLESADFITGGVQREVLIAMRILVGGVLLLVLFGAGTTLAQNQAATQNPMDLVPIQEAVKKADALLNERKMVECVDLVEQLTKRIRELVEIASAQDLAEIKKIHDELAKSHHLLSVEGADLPELPTWDALIQSKKSKPPLKEEVNNALQQSSSALSISFSKDIAPWLVGQCSRCHINAQRGGFSLATFNDLVKGSKGGVVLFPGDPIGSRLVETVETGDMPRSGNKVSAENLAKLKQWVLEGAKFDGPSSDAPIANLSSNPPSNNIPNIAPTKAPPIRVPAPTKIAAPSGKEIVSFVRDVAPILMANCNGCHYGATRVSGGLQFNMFSQILKGGDSGPIVSPGKPDVSLIIRKLQGTEGARMPMGRAPLSDSQIRLVAAWIKEGATFDGKDKDTKLDQVVGQAFAAKASHGELMAKRMERTRDSWKRALPKVDPDQLTDEQFHIIGNIGDENTKTLLTQANSAAKQIRKMFKIAGKEPLIKGGITIFALKQRYDYSEFGKMIESRTLPAEWSSHWRSEVLDSYVAIVFDKAETKINESSLIQQLTSLWMSSHEGVPRWFSDGAGRQALATTVGINDARVQPWLKRMAESMQQVKNLNSLSDGSMNDEALATIGFGIVHSMYDAKMKTQYETIVRSLASGMSFEKATMKTIGPVDVFLQGLLGKTK